MPLPTRILTRGNVDGLIDSYATAVETIGERVVGQSGIDLLLFLKRGTVGVGPYPAVSLFEAANRIMTDLTILHGVRSLLRNDLLPFDEYVVELGHEDRRNHDIEATKGDSILIGEAFNVAPSFFGAKKSTALKKLRTSQVKADYKVIVCNHDSVALGYAPQPQIGEFFLFVDIGAGLSRAVPDLGPPPTLAAEVRNRHR